MAWYLRLYKLGPYKGLPEKAVGARGAPNFLQADEDSIDDADYLAIGRVANHGLMGKEDLDSLEARRLQEEAVLLSKQVQHLAIECLNAGVLSPAELSLGGPWISPSLATAPPLSPGELTALNVEVHPRHANGTADKAQQLSAITQSMQASAAARAGNRSSKAQQGRSAGGRGRGRELLDEHQAVIEAAEEQTQGMPDPSRELYLRAVALGPPAFKGIDDHRGRVLGIRDSLAEMAHFLARRAQLCAGLLGPEACEDVMRGLHGAGAELLLVWRSDLAGPQLQRLLSHLAEYDVGKKRSDLREDEHLRRAVRLRHLRCPLTVRVPTFSDLQHLMQQMAVINEDMTTTCHLTFCVRTVSTSSTKQAGQIAKPNGFPAVLEIYQPEWKMLSGPAVSTIPWPVTQSLTALVQRVVRLSQEPQSSQPVLGHGADETTWLKVLGLLASVHITKQYAWRWPSTIKAFTVHAIPVLKGGKWDLVSTGKARRAASAAPSSDDPQVQLRLGPEMLFDPDCIALAAYQFIMDNTPA